MSDIHNPDIGIAPPGAKIEAQWGNELIYQGSSATWQDIDGKVGPALLLLRIAAQNDGTDAEIDFKNRSATGTSVNGSCVVSYYRSAVSQTAGYAFVPTDASGYIQIKTSHTVANIDVYRVAYWKCAMPRTVWHTTTPPTSFQDFDTGIKNALVLLRLSGSANAGQCHFRQNGDTATEAQNSYDLGAFLSKDANCDAYIAMITDSGGLLEYCTGLEVEISLTLEAYIPLYDMTEEQLFDGAMPAAWTDLTTNYGKALLFCKVSGNDNGSQAMDRVNGETLESGTACGALWLQAQLNKRGYGFMLTDFSGITEWLQADAHNMTITKLAALK